MRQTIEAGETRPNPSKPKPVLLYGNCRGTRVDPESACTASLALPQFINN
jgi:hypothetical protein